MPKSSRLAIGFLVGIAAAPLQVFGASPAPVIEPIEADWRDIPDDELLVMDLAGDRHVVIRLAPAYAPQHVANVRALAKAGWWNGTSIYRVQDNWVAQWGDVTEKKPLPADMVERPAAEYDFPRVAFGHRLTRSDPYSTESGISSDGWPLAGNGQLSWLAHCYATVGVARGDAPDTGTGSELFVAIAGSARRLDRNYTVVGRVVEGMGFLAALPRSSARMGFYETPAEHTAIVSVALARDLPAARRPHYQYRAVDNPRFAALVQAKVAPAPPTVALGGIDVCDVPLEIRKRPPA